MGAVAGIVNSFDAAAEIVNRLRAAGFDDEKISVLTPGDRDKQVDLVPKTETEQSGTGKAIGGVVGASIGAAGGLTLGATASLILPGAGLVLAAGLIGGAILGTLGAVAGSAAGDALEESIAKGLPIDDVFVYEHAIRQGQSVVIVITGDASETHQAQTIFDEAGAASINEAREGWWKSLRGAEESHYRGQHGDFGTGEADYRRGFEAALHPRARRRSYEEAVSSFPLSNVSDKEAFRLGYERGCQYLAGLDKGSDNVKGNLSRRRAASQKERGNSD